MRLFLLAFFLVYGSMHTYAFVKARSGLGLGWITGTALALWMLFMVTAPVVVRISENAGLELTARVLSHVAYVWLGILFFFFCAALAMDLYRMLVGAVGLMAKKNMTSLLPSAKLLFFVPLAYALIASGYGYFEARNIMTEKITIQTSKLPPGVDNLRIVQITDVHLGLIVRSERLGLILDKVRALKPDLLVSTGDLVDGQIDEMTGLAELLGEISPRYGKYAVTGNHEFYAGVDQALRFTEDSGFKILRGEAVSDVINIAGVEDPTGARFDVDTFVPEAVLLKDLPEDKFTLLLKHRPDIDSEAQGMFDLQLSGHSHKGQLWPFYYVVKLLYPAVGRHDLEGGQVMYVSRGSGTWGPPVRFLAPPEVTLIELVRK